VKEIDRLLQVAKIGRAERIDQIRTQIESGTYAVSGEAVAHKLINAHMR
jgi:anti-sigma28 factor (negative regulator of flagellin synthesis)